MAAPVLAIRDLQVSFATHDATVAAVRGVSLEVARGETLAIVGESGSGKSQVMLAALGLLARNGRAEGSVRLDGAELLGAPDRVLDQVRGSRVAMIFQEPMTSLDPLFSVGRQMALPIERHQRLTAEQVRARCIELLQMVRLRDPEVRISAYPHELSGGERQRVMIAMAIANNPGLLIADEPTTALDVTVQVQVLELLVDLKQRLGMALVLISHDLNVVRRYADRVAVMHGGQIVETGAVEGVFASPQQTYTRKLIAAEPVPRKVAQSASYKIPSRPPAELPVHLSPSRAARIRAKRTLTSLFPPPLRGRDRGWGVRSDGWASAPPPSPTLPPSRGKGEENPEVSTPQSERPPAPLLEGRDIRVAFPLPRKTLVAPRRELVAVDGVSVRVTLGETLGIVGESGSGKSTLGRALLRLAPAEGEITFDGHALHTMSRDALRPLRRDLAVVFQDPFGSLSPRMTASEIVSEGLLVHEPGLAREERDRRAATAFAEVELDPATRHRFPHEFSGGQRQRIAIARAIILQPKLVLLDEPTSALDRTVQKAIVELLARLQAEHGLTYLFISHDLAVVRAVADRIVVMKSGRVVEEGAAGAVIERPQHAYTKELMRAAFTGSMR